MNILIASGNLGSDAEQKTTPSGIAVLSFSLPVKAGYGDKAKTTWVKCALFGKRAEGGLAQYLVKGAKVLVHGEIYLDEWQGTDGTMKSTLKMNVNEIELIGSKNDNQPAPKPDQKPAHQTPKGHVPPPHVPEFDGFDDDSIPF